MQTDPIVLLKEIAKQSRKTVRSTNLFDANVCASPANPERPWEVLALPGDIFRHELSLVRDGRKATLRANGEFLVLEVSGSFDVELCSINRRDKIFQLQSYPVRIPRFSSFPVFSQPNSDLSHLLSSTALNQALDALKLKSSESVHLCSNHIVLYLQPESAREAVSAVGTLCKLARELPVLDERQDLSGLPAQFECLADLIKKWAVSDDEARSEMIEHTSPKRLKNFVVSVLPHISEINKYLDSFGNRPLSEAATALGRVAECALEAQMKIGDS